MNASKICPATRHPSGLLLLLVAASLVGSTPGAVPAFARLCPPAAASGFFGGSPTAVPRGGSGLHRRVGSKAVPRNMMSTAPLVGDNASSTAAPNLPVGGGTVPQTTAPPPSVVKNFRPVRMGTPAPQLPHAPPVLLYRCAKPDGLARLVREGTASSCHPRDHWMLREATLVLDLRSESERDPEMCRLWWSEAPGGPFVGVDSAEELERSLKNPPPPGARRHRHVLRLDPLDPAAFMRYLEDNWLTPRERLLVGWYKLVDGQASHDLRIQVLNRRGLLGLNQAILEAGAPHLCQALRALTLHAEWCLRSSPAFVPAVVHCVQGKDRTGMLCLCVQHLLGASDDDIVDAYSASEAELSSGSAAIARAYSGAIDRQFFAGAPPQVMLATLAWLRDRYGGVDGYLDAIGFDAAWRLRFLTASESATSETLVAVPSSKL